ncbi:MAG TPA: alpha/beta hydrolase [Candidatus Methylomirabilis sp.]|nr:alpha/beta hydrolase [Candidatus Methylomirabilis sp.]
MGSATVATRRGAVEYASLGDGPTVLALHGAMGGYDQGVILARTIGAPGYRFVAVSRPGYLGTPLTAGRTPEEQADLCADLLDALGVSKAAVMAVSGGGPCALQFALRHRDRCWGLVLVSTCSGKIETRIPLTFRITLLARWSWFAAAMQRRATRDPEAAARRSIPDPVVRARTLRDPDAGPLFAALLLSTSDRMALRLPGTENDIRVTRTTAFPLEQIAVPVLVVHGTADRLVPFPEHGRALATRIPGAELLAIEGGEHVAIFTHRTTVRARVAEFLRTHAPTAANSGCGRMRGVMR